MAGEISKLPPQNVEAEQSVLGAILIDNDALNKVLEFLEEGDFYRENHRKIFRAIIELYQKNEPADLVTVTDLLKSHGVLEDACGPAYLASLASSVPTSANVTYYAKIVHEKALLRRIIAGATEIVDRGYNEGGDVEVFLDDAERIIFDVAQRRIKQSFYVLRDIIKDSFKTIEKLYERKELITGVASGFVDIDRLTSGLQPSDLIIVAGRPSMGKTALALNMASYAAMEKGIPCAVFSLEMSKEQLVQRLLCSEAKVGGSKLRGGFLTESDWPRLTRAAGALSEAPLYIDDTPALSVLEMRAKARRLQKEKGLGMVMVDYLQLMRSVGGVESREREISEISRSLKALAKELHVPVVAISQLNRAVESRQDRRPQMADLRECVTGDALVCLTDGRRQPIADLVGKTPDVWAIDSEGRIVTAHSDKVWKVGVRKVFNVNLASGRSIRATEKHRLLGAGGWRQIGEMGVGDRIALARHIPEPSFCEKWPDEHLILLGHLIGDGSYLNHQPLRYTTSSEENSKVVTNAAEKGFGVRVNRHESGRSWHQLVFSGNGNRWHHVGINAWLRSLGVFNQRSCEKRVPKSVFCLSNRQVALLLQHLWATDGTISPRKNSQCGSHAVYYSTNSVGLAKDVAALLLRLGIVARIHTVKQGKYLPSQHVEISGSYFQQRFLDIVDAFGPRVEGAKRLKEILKDTECGTNVDTLPNEIFQRVRIIMAAQGISHRAMASMRGTSYGGSAHFKFAPSRAVIAEYARLLNSDDLYNQARNDIFWDRIVSIEEGGEEDVYDLTVIDNACWLADGVVSHNSGAIEQDADVIMFVYRDEMYNRDSQEKGVAEIIIAKQRNGPIGFAKLAFISELTRFENLAKGMDGTAGQVEGMMPAEDEDGASF